MAEERAAKVRCVYVQTTLHLWRFDFEAIDLTQLFDFREKGVPLAAAGFVWNSKLFFVGGEKVKPDTPHIKLVPISPYEDDAQFEAMYDFENHPENHPSYTLDRLRRLFPCSKGFLKLFRDSLNKEVYFLDNFYDSNSEPIVPTLTLSRSESHGTKTWPFVVPMKDKFYVIARAPLFYSFPTSHPSFEVFDPVDNSWEELDEPPYRGCRRCFAPTYFPSRSAFEFAGKIFLFAACGTGLDEMSFDLQTKKWQASWQGINLFQDQGYIPLCMINVADNLYLGISDLGISAYRYYGCGKPIGVQGLSKLTRMCLPTWACYWVPSSTLCNLGDGLVLYVSTSFDPERKRLHFNFVRFKVMELSDITWANHFVSWEFIDAIHKVVDCEDPRPFRSTTILKAYVL